MNDAGQTNAESAVDGEPSTRLTCVSIPRGRTKTDLTTRLQQLADLREKYRTGKTGPTVDQILEDVRADLRDMPATAE